MISLVCDLDSLPRLFPLNVSEYKHHLRETTLREVEELNKEIKWDGMWDSHEMDRRLDSGEWDFYILLSDNNTIGWVWYEQSTFTLKNLYVNIAHRNKGNGKALIASVMWKNYARLVPKIYTKVDDWNTGSLQAFFALNWKVY